MTDVAARDISVKWAFYLEEAFAYLMQDRKRNLGPDQNGEPEGVFSGSFDGYDVSLAIHCNDFVCLIRKNTEVYALDYEEVMGIGFVSYTHGKKEPQLLGFNRKEIFATSGDRVSITTNQDYINPKLSSHMTLPILAALVYSVVRAGR